MISRLAPNMNLDITHLDAGLLDGEHLDRQTFGDVMLERELLELFERQCERLGPVIAGAGGARERFEAAHALKGSARAIGAWRVAAMAERAENLLSQGEVTGLALLRREFADAISATQDAIVRRRCAGLKRPTPLAIGSGMP